MAEIFKMPKLGMDMEEGTIIKWLKAEGDAVAKGEPLVEIETDKSTVEVEAPISGTVLKLYYSEETTKDCGAPIAVIGQPGEEVPAVNAPSGRVLEAVTAAAAPAPLVETENDLFFLMPKLGMDMEEGTIVKWLKAEGDEVKKGEPFAEIETDKSTVEVEALVAGVVLKLYYPEGETIACGKPIAAIGEKGQQAPELATASPASAAIAVALKEVDPVQQPVFQAPRDLPCTSGKLRVTPRARRLAQKENIDLHLISGTGPSGRIVEQDVRDFLVSGGGRAAVVPVRVPAETVRPLTGVRRVTAKRMRESLSEMAQTNTRMDVDMTNMMSFRKQMNARLEKEGIKISFLDLLVAVCARALIEHPQANVSLQDDGIHYKNYANIGIAVDSEKGLVVPVIKDADVLSIPEISRVGKELVEKARKGVLQPGDMKGGTFTISNLGMFEVDSFTAIVNPPETCILAVGRIAERPVVENGQIAIRPMMNLCLSYDHRVIDGAPSARFLQEIKRYIENPVWLLLG